jgi:hypothetical protein
MGIKQSGTRATPRMDLGVAVMEHIGQENQFIGTRVFPVFETNKKESSFAKITRESMAKTVDTKRSKGSGYNRGGFETEDGSYTCEENGHEIPVDDGEREMYRSDFEAEFVASKIAMNRVLLNQEIRIKNLIFNTSTFTGSDLYTDRSSAPWDTAGSDVLSHVRTAKKKVRQNCGLKPNALIIGDQTLENLKSNTGIKDSIKYVKEMTDEALREALAGLFGLEQVIVGGAIYDSADEGQDFSASDIWADDYAMIARIATDGRDFSQPALGRTFLWTADSPENAMVEEYRDESIRSDVYRSRQHTDEILIDKYFGHLLEVDA